MVALVRSAEARELPGIRIPVEIAAVNHSSAHLGGVAVHILGRGMGYNVGTPFEWPAVDRSGESIVHNKRHTVPVGYPGEPFNVEDLASRIGDGLAEETFCIRPESRLDFLIAAVLVDECAADAHLLQCYPEKVESAAVDGVCGNDVVTCGADVHHREEIGGLA